MLTLAAFGAVHADPNPFPRPPALEADVQFWQRIYSKVSTHGGLLHDDRHLDIVYEELTFPTGLSFRERSNLVDTVRAHYERMLRRLGTGARDDLSDDERRVLALFPVTVSDATLTDAADHVRFQLGQSDRFREGLVRSGTWEKHVEDTLRREGLPGDLAALPHVESSFNPRAYSKVGAAGLWQFMRGTGKRWLRVDGTIDERLDPYKSTLAAAQFLNINYSMLGTWPLALTAWNHGAAGMKRAKEEMGTDDITTILRNYQGRTFGFASRNFYVSFLAALEVDRNAERYFGKVDRMPRDDSRTVRLPALMPAQALEKALGTDPETLRSLNMSLLDPIWAGRKPVPRGFELRVPAGVDPGRLLTRLGQKSRDDAPRERVVTVGRGDTLDRIATQFGFRTRELAEFNHVSPRDVHPGMTIKVPSAVPTAETAQLTGPEADAPSVGSSGGAAAVPESPPATHVVAHGESLGSIARETGVPAAVQAAPNASEPREGGADTADYAVRDGFVRVEAGETLGALAHWGGVSVSRLLQINHLKADGSVPLGHRVRIELAGTDAAGFEARRVAYHRGMEAAFFSTHRLTGSDARVAQAGDTLWTLTRQGQIPVWLLRRYNPDVDFSLLRPGMPIKIPRVDAPDNNSDLGKGVHP